MRSACGLAAASAFFLARGRSGAWIRWTIYAVIVVCGAARSFLLPARNALGADETTGAAVQLGTGEATMRAKTIAFRVR